MNCIFDEGCASQVEFKCISCDVRFCSQCLIVHLEEIKEHEITTNLEEPKQITNSQRNKVRRILASKRKKAPEILAETENILGRAREDAVKQVNSFFDNLDAQAHQLDKDYMELLVKLEADINDQEQLSNQASQAYKLCFNKRYRDDLRSSKASELTVDLDSLEGSLGAAIDLKAAFN